MLKFFRQIRRRLIINGKLKSYSAYAVGEILLVMIGILLAIQVNNWNEARKERELEKSYLTNLKKDLLRDKKDLTDIVEKRKKKVEAFNMLLDQVDADTPSEYPADMKSYFFTMGGWITFNPNENAITEILSSGDLRVIKTQQIKDDLLELRNRYLKLENVREHLRREYEEYIYNTIYTVEDFRMLLTEEEAKKFMYTILQIPTFTNGMISASRNQNELIRQSEKILDLIDNLLSQIEEELNR